MADLSAVIKKSVDQPPPAATSMTLKREMYFPTIIYSLDLPDPQIYREMNSRILRHIYAWRDADAEGRSRSNVKDAGSWHSQTDMAKRLEYSDLVELVLTCAQSVFQDMGYDEAYGPVIDMWANINPPHGYNRSHFHPDALWSGVYYLQTPLNCGSIRFFDPRTEASMITPRVPSDQPRNPQTMNETSFAPVEGRIILFPAWLLHEVEANMSEAEGRAGDRISVSFNISQRQ